MEKQASEVRINSGDEGGHTESWETDKKKGKHKHKGKQPKNEEDEPRQIWFCQMFRFATKFDVFLMIVGSIGAIAMGAAMPAFAFIWGQSLDDFGNQSPDAAVKASRETMFIFIYVGIGAFFAGWLMFACWMITGERQAISCRKAYLRSLLRQEIGWFDMINQTELASKFAVDTFAFQGAIGEKISTLLMTLATFVAGFIFAFISGWLMTLVVLATIPALGIAGAIFMGIISEKDRKQAKSYAAAGGRAEQAIAAIKTVKQLNGQQYESMQYETCLEKAAKNSLKYAIYSGIGMGLFFFVILASYSLGFWFGSKCVAGTQQCLNKGTSGYTPGDVLIVFFSVMMGGFNLTQLSPAFKKISEGRQAAARIYSVIDREPLIKNPPNGVKIQDFRGVIKFENVTFAYPKDRSRIVLKNLDLDFDINKTGLMGESGCGKSTTLQLILRFYDPDEGRITVDGVDLRTIDLIWWRQQIGYVGQEPVLFATTIRENLLFGKDDSTDTEINDALKKAEAYDFVMGLEKKLDTYVGYGGGQLSGGQKQRIAIARAILKQPKIVLLDEATSALDRRNQRLIQNTLDKVSQGRTTITVAHRVKTVMSSDIIYVFDKGGIAEKGPFKSLSLAKNYNEEEDDDFEQAPKPELKAKISSRKQSGYLNLDIAQEIEDNADKFMTDEDREKAKQKQILKKYDKHIFSRLFKYSKSKWFIFLLGSIAAILNGVIFPIFSIFLSKILVSLFTIDIYPNDKTAIDNINLYALIFLILGIGAFIMTTIQTTCFTVVGEEVTRKLRIQTFFKMLKMPVPWFDITRNNAGTLTARLSTDCNLVNTLTTTVISVMIQSLSTLIAGIVIAFVYEWRTALVALGLLPLMIICGVIQMAFSTGFSDKTDEAYKNSSNLIMEAMINIRTVSSFGYEGVVAKKYDEKMQEPYELAIKKGNTAGFFFGLSQFIMFVIFGLLFFLGSVFVRDNADATTEEMFVAVYAILFAGMTAGNNFHFMPDVGAAKNSAANLFQIQDSTDEDQMQINERSKLLTSDIEGDIVLQNVDFKYDSRNEYVFKNMNLTVKKGNKVAFVGTSGCGKSTILQLLQRFYYFEHGHITINGNDIKDYDIHYLRNSFGVVSQEPVLFNGTFKDNIQYNLPNVSDQEIEESATKANALSFILGNEDQGPIPMDNQEKTGFNRNVGVRGSQISGGQKQRVAIARTILRNPRMLLLDEATSALDSTNQKKVQDSLDKIMLGKTVISVAHRIETIKNSDEIFMFEKGKIVESGSYSELIAKQGYFYNLEKGTSFT